MGTSLGEVRVADCCRVTDSSSGEIPKDWCESEVLQSWWAPTGWRGGERGNDPKDNKVVREDI